MAPCGGTLPPPAARFLVSVAAAAAAAVGGSGPNVTYVLEAGVAAGVVVRGAALRDAAADWAAGEVAGGGARGYVIDVSAAVAGAVAKTDTFLLQVPGNGG